MPVAPDRSQLSLPLESATSRNGGSGEERHSQQKLMKSFSTPADYSARANVDPQFYSSNSSRSSRDSRGYAQLNRAQSIRDTISSGTAKFFGVPPPDDRQSPFIGAVVDPKWNSRRLRYICKRYGNPKEDAVAKELRPQPLDDLIDVPSPSKSVTPQDEMQQRAAFAGTEFGETFLRSRSVESRASRIHPRLERRDSVMKMAYDRLSAIVQWGTFRPRRASGVKRGRSTSSSFSPFSIQQNGNVTQIKIGPPATESFAVSEHETKEIPVVPPLAPLPIRRANFAIIRQDQIAKMKPVPFISKAMSTVEEADDEGSREHSKLESMEHEQEKHGDGKVEISGLKKGRPVIHFQSAVEVHHPTSLEGDTIGQPSENSRLVAEAPQVSRVPLTASTGHVSLKEKVSLPLSITSMESLHDEVFFDVTPSSVAPFNISSVERGTSGLPGEQVHPPHIQRFGSRALRRVPLPVRNNEHALRSIPFGDYPGDSLLQTGAGTYRPVQTGGKLGRMDRPLVPENLQTSTVKELPTSFSSWRGVISSPGEYLLHSIHAGGRKIKGAPDAIKNGRKKSILDLIQEKLKSQKYYVPHRRRVGLGFGIWRKYVRRTYKKDAYQSNQDAYVDYRPFFTYWVTTVQILVTIVSLCTYGIGPWGFGRTERTGDVLHSTVTLKHVGIYEQQNFWFGPKFADLVHLGAKFAPCMRKDPRIFAQIKADREEENETGCCIYNDGTGCFQTGRLSCPSLIATLSRWRDDDSGPDGRKSGAVCGQDPRYCEDPASVRPFEWPDDITEWPICRQTTPFVPENEKHMQCEITGRPCCIQLHGQCRITTREYCDFVEGYFHENATLCSQVSCLNEVCGMLPFLRKNEPNQWYRLFIPLFLHAGILHCLWTVFIQIFYMRDLEKLLGWARISLLYMVSGIGGYLASAIFVPYKPEVGPAGSHVGMFAAMYVDVVYSWNLLERPWHAIMQLSLFMLVLFAVGTLPWVDNWAHLFGFIFGFLVSLAVLPYIQTKSHNRARRLLIVIASLSAALSLFIVLLTIFYWLPGFDCPYCEYFNCIPYTDHFCDNQGLRLKSWLPI